ncbi:UNVERIFIED_CONTAM: hypothetical protein Sradi_5770700 [Sesamum radiatum]|uniref:PHD-type domain-containing protein n=1 Tax=Sesamum radiatum TaxID=300843 RepID=A0AAW2KNN2_SESRA
MIRNQGLVDRVGSGQERDSSENTCIRNDIYYSQPCKICEHLDSTSNMLICDNCLDAFHMSCCNPCIKRIPVGEWLCTSCSKKRHKILKEKSISITSEIGNGNSASEGELGSIEFMFTDTEPYMSNVRIGDEFQADVPDWSSPTYKERDPYVDWLEMDSSNNGSMQEQNYTKPLKLSSIGNWLQCQGLIEGIGEGGEGTICGKWRSGTKGKQIMLAVGIYGDGTQYSFFLFPEGNSIFDVGWYLIPLNPKPNGDITSFVGFNQECKYYSSQLKYLDMYLKNLLTFSTMKSHCLKKP